MKNQKTIAERIKDAVVGKKALDGLKTIKSELRQDQWLKAWKANGQKMEDWIGSKNFSKT